MDKHIASRGGFSLIEVLVFISIMAVAAVYLTAASKEVYTEDKFYQTCYRMEEIKDAVIGKQGQYRNGIEAFNGYVSDMGHLPDLYYTDDDGNLVKLTRSDSDGLLEITEENALAGILEQGHRPQPRALWEKTETTPEWGYHEKYRIWAGWRGPYVNMKGEDSLKDAWGNDFIFVAGEVVGHGEDNEAGSTYRCKKTYKAQLDPDDTTDPETPDNQGRPGTTEGNDYWEVIREGEEMNARIWLDLGMATNPFTGKAQEAENSRFLTQQEIFYGPGCLTIISLGADNAPGGEGLDKDIQIIIYPTEYTGEVAGHIGYHEQDESELPDSICLYYPDYTAEGGKIAEACLKNPANNAAEVVADEVNKPDNPYSSDDDEELYAGINFRFGRVSALKGNHSWHCDSDDGSGNCVPIDWEKVCYWECAYLDGMGEYKLCNDVLNPETGSCTECITYSSSDNACIEALCPGNDTDKPVKCFDFLNESSDNWYLTCKYYESACVVDTDKPVKWSCSEDTGDCTETWEQEEDDDPENFMQRYIPVGIRTLELDSGTYYTTPVGPGGNWAGTVRSQETGNKN